MPQLRLLVHHHPTVRVAPLRTNSFQLTQDIQEFVEIVLVLLRDGTSTLLRDVEEGACYGADFLDLRKGV